MIARLYLLICLAMASVASHAVDDRIERGAYLVTAGGCATCHTVEDGQAQDKMAGGRALESPFGTFYTPNITPDPDTGIGAWSDDDFINALRHGVSPDGSHYYPAFPYTSYTGITDDDLLAMKAYLDSIAPIRRENRDHELDWYATVRASLGLWKLLFFDPGVYSPSQNRGELWNRGAYLVRHLGHCGECHTPRNVFGAVDDSRALGGNPDGPEGDTVPNITSDEASGIGDWTESDLSDLLEIGMYPDGDFVGGSMVEVVDHSTAKLTPEDRQAIIAYLKTVPPVAGEPGE